MRNVYLKNDGELQFGGVGRLARIKDLEDDVCCGNAPISGMVQVDSGVWIWTDNTEDKESVEDVGETVKYVYHSEIQTLYTELLNDLKGGIETIISCGNDENDLCLRAVTRSTCNNTIYIYNYSRQADGEVDKVCTIAHIGMFNSLFML